MSAEVVGWPWVLTLSAMGQQKRAGREWSHQGMMQPELGWRVKREM